jgi:putative transposase
MLMRPISYVRHRFPAEIIQQAIWLYLRFTLSLRDVEDLLAARGLDVSYETIRRWVLKFGPAVARALGLTRPTDNELNRGCRLRPSKVFHRSAIE